MTGMIIIFSSAAGAVCASLFACVPGLHVYSVLGLLYVMIHSGLLSLHLLPPEVIVPFTAGMVTGYAVANTLPSVILAAPDESSLFTVLPGMKLLGAGKGYEAVIITSIGSLAGLILVVFVLGPFAPMILPASWFVLRDHTGWILWCVICFMLMSEWPKGGTMGQGGLKKFIDGWQSTGAGILVFILSGLLGLILFHRSPVASGSSFQNLLPAFVGLFTVPGLIINMFSSSEMPDQELSSNVFISQRAVMRGSIAGCLGGGFAAFFPVITGGVGGLLAGHASALRDDRSFLVSQGASKLVYYVGGFLMLFVPMLNASRGTAARMVRGVYAPGSYGDYYMALASIAIAGMVSVLIILPLAKVLIRLMTCCSYKRISAVSMAIVFMVVVVSTGMPGVGVMAAAAGIGLMPMLFGTRRMNCLGVILLPMALSQG